MCVCGGGGGGGGGGGEVGLEGTEYPLLTFMCMHIHLCPPNSTCHLGKWNQKQYINFHCLTNAGNSQLPTPHSNTSSSTTAYVTNTIMFSPLSDVYNVLPTVTELPAVTQLSTSHTTPLSAVTELPAQTQIATSHTHLSAVTELPAETQIATSHTTHLSTGPLTLDLPTPLPSNQVNDKESTSGLNTAVIAGTATGCVLLGLVVAIAFLSFFCMARKRRQFCCKTARVDAAAGECMYLSHAHIIL